MSYEAQLNELIEKSTSCRRLPAGPAREAAEKEFAEFSAKLGSDITKDGTLEEKARYAVNKELRLLKKG